ncbi:MAG: hypothetical protein GDA38_25955 [Hormoscilla sp. SP12CHS1]|nr:hypothetical protein [Hormoscilla sp. SP12CHS1]
MSNNQSSNDRLDRIEAALENLMSVVAEIQQGQIAMQQERMEMQQEHLQLVRIVAQQQNHIVEINAEIKEIKLEIKGLQTESLRLMEHCLANNKTIKMTERRSPALIVDLGPPLPRVKGTLTRT